MYPFRALLRFKITLDIVIGKMMRKIYCHQPICKGASQYNPNAKVKSAYPAQELLSEAIAIFLRNVSISSQTLTSISIGYNIYEQDLTNAVMLANI